MGKVVRLEAGDLRLTHQTPQLPKGLGDRIQSSRLRDPYRCDPGD
jgi:hypothetical protein